MSHLERTISTIVVPTSTPEVAPAPAHPGDAGHDLRSNVSVDIAPGATVAVGTGLKLEIPDGFVGMVCSRSGLALHDQVTVANAPGIVDSGFRGEIKVILHNASVDTPFFITPGDRIAQLVITPFVVADFVPVESLNNSSRGADGFGSTSIA